MFQKMIIILILIVVVAVLYFIFDYRSTTSMRLEPITPNIPELSRGGAATDLQIEVLKDGTGTGAKVGDTITVHYTGTLTSGQKFDSSLDGGQPFSFKLGGGLVIQGWDKGLVGMKIGEKRRLVIPPNLAYGDRGAGGTIPPGATLIFEVEMLKIN
jgi:FKBP-type peptidyl-prolyl cis-trans isomerase